MKINFKQPKYVVPLILLPFVIFGFFILGGKFKSEQENPVAEKAEGINTNMPGVDTSISKGEIKDKFQAYQQAFKNVTDQSAMSDIDQSGTGVQGMDYQSSYSFADKQRLEAQRKMDSLNAILRVGQHNVQSKKAQYENGGGFEYDADPPSRHRQNDVSTDPGESDNALKTVMQMQEQERQRKNAQSIGDENPDSYDSQMRVFRDQMKYMDSLQQANGVVDKTNKNGTNNKSYHKDFNPAADTSFKPLPVTAALPKSESNFNTVRNFDEDDNSIAAVIDQDIKVSLGSRVRIRLLKDMYAGDYLIKNGSYIYGVVTGFQKQRLNISIAQILYNNISLPVNIDLFDNDGYLGLYVPGSDFREFSKAIGTQATQGLSQAVTPDNSDIKMNMLSQLFNTSTTTLSTLMKKNKAFLKYNSIVFLKENKNSSND